MTVTFDTSVLLGLNQSRQYTARVAAEAGAAKTAKVPTAPWTTTSGKAQTPSALVTAALSGKSFIDPSAAKLDAAAAPADYKDLFALHQGLSMLEALATEAQATSTTAARRAELNQSFAAGMKQVSAFLDGQPFDKLSVARGATAASQSASTTVKRETPTYVTTGLTEAAGDEIDGLDDNAQFSLKLAKASGASTTVSFDLSEMTQPRTVANVVSYLNDKLNAAGVLTRFAVQRTPGQPQTVQAGGKTITLGTSPDTFGLKLNGVTGETPTFSASATAPAVYVAHATGADATTARELVKLDGSGPAAGSLFGRALPDGLTNVRATATAADGSLYVLADGKGKVDGQALKGSSDVVLLRYDSAGKLSYSRSLGAAASASGFALAVSPDGKSVAVAGQVTGALGDDGGGSDPAVGDSFVSVYDASGVEKWTRRGSATSDDAATAVAFGADGSVYVAGRTRSALQGQQSSGGQDGYLQAYSPTGAKSFATQFGTSGDDRAVGLATTADGAVVVAGVENGRGVLRRFEPPFAAGQQPSAVRDLGDLGGGELLGVSVAADGTLRVAGAARGGVAVGDASAGYPGGRAVFAASLSADLTASSADRVAWWSPGADTTSTAMTVSGGKVYVTGTTPVVTGGHAGTQGFAVALDPLTGTSGWSRSFTGGGGQDAPSAISVDPAGLSVLDRLGLPSGTVDYSDATDLVSATSLRPGDSFRIAVGGGAARTVSIDTGDTLSELAAKINRATGFASAAKVQTVGGRDVLLIAPARSGVVLSLSSGPAGTDALKALGLGEGVIQQPSTGKDAKPSYGLNLTGLPGLTDVASSKAAVARLSTAVTFVRGAWADLANAASGPAKPGKQGGTVPAYLQAQIANYQSALARLGG